MFVQASELVMREVPFGLAQCGLLSTNSPTFYPSLGLYAQFSFLIKKKKKLKVEA
jgi:hypothetical protein